MNITGIDVHTYMVKDLSRAIAFYRDVLQLPLATIGENAAEFELLDGSAFELWNPRRGELALGARTRNHVRRRERARSGR